MCDLDRVAQRTSPRDYRVGKNSPLADATGHKEARREDHKDWCECLDRALPDEEYATEGGRVGE